MHIHVSPLSPRHFFTGPPRHFAQFLSMTSQSVLPAGVRVSAVEQPGHPLPAGGATDRDRDAQA